jgi:hypothetical protein
VPHLSIVFAHSDSAVNCGYGSQTEKVSGVAVVAGVDEHAATDTTRPNAASSLVGREAGNMGVLPGGCADDKRSNRFDA